MWDEELGVVTLGLLGADKRGSKKWLAQCTA
jgi:hypothetical protein